MASEDLLSSERYRQGLSRLAEVDGAAGQRVIDALAPIAPDLARYVVEFGFGDVYSRPGLDLRAREIATVAALVALAHARPQLEVHLHAALNVGCTRQELVEVIIQMSLYAGFPAALNAMAAARAVFDERGEAPAAPPTLRQCYDLSPPRSLDASRTALLMVDWQRQFLSGPLALSDLPAAVARARELLAWARRNGLAIVHVHQVSALPGGIFEAGSEAVAPIAGLEPEAGEWRLTKSAGGALGTTDLGPRLSAQGIDQLIVAGLMAHHAVDATVREGAARGFRVLVVSDATATRSLPTADGSAVVPAAEVRRVLLAALADRYDVLSAASLLSLPFDQP